MLIDHLWSNEPGLTDELAATLNELTSLHRAEHSRVALRARQVRFNQLSKTRVHTFIGQFNELSS